MANREDIHEWPLGGPERLTGCGAREAPDPTRNADLLPPTTDESGSGRAASVEQVAAQDARLAQIRAEVGAGTYLTPEKLDTALLRMLQRFLDETQDDRLGARARPAC